jgi:hypothetical protein
MLTNLDIKNRAYAILGARAGGRVERCHSIPHQGSYSNAAHSWGVAMLMQQIWPEDFPRLALACLTHDIPEFWVGDIPAPTMRAVPGLKESLVQIEDRCLERLELPGLVNLSEEDYRKLKACDWLEFWLWCKDQEYIGNGFVKVSKIEIESYIETMKLPNPADWLYGVLKDMDPLVSQGPVLRDIIGRMQDG